MAASIPWIASDVGFGVGSVLKLEQQKMTEAKLSHQVFLCPMPMTAINRCFMFRPMLLISGRFSGIQQAWRGRWKWNREENKLVSCSDFVGRNTTLIRNQRPAAFSLICRLSIMQSYQQIVQNSILLKSCANWQDLKIKLQKYMNEGWLKSHGVEIESSAKEVQELRIKFRRRIREVLCSDSKPPNLSQKVCSNAKCSLLGWSCKRNVSILWCKSLYRSEAGRIIIAKFTAEPYSDLESARNLVLSGDMELRNFSMRIFPTRCQLIRTAFVLKSRL